jgi:glycosyltransferase involved in cell wall biosynthesis
MFTPTVVTLKPSYPTPEAFRDRPSDDWKFPFKIIRTVQFYPHRGGMVLRAFREISMAIYLGIKARKQRPMVVISSSPSMYLGPVGHIVARLKRALFVWDIRDLTWQYAEQQTRGFTKRLLCKAQSACMFRCARRADLVTCANEGIATVLAQRGVPQEKLLVIPNGVSPEFIAGMQGIAQQSAHNNEPVVSYIGLLGLNQGLRTLLDVAIRLPRVSFVLVGDGPQRAALEREAQDRNLRNITFRGYLAGDDLYRAYQRSDILFAQVRDLPVLADAMWSAKLYEYMGASRPIIFAGKGPAADDLTKTGAGVVVPPENAEAIAAAIELLLKDRTAMVSMGRRGFAHVIEHCRRDHLMAALPQELTRRLTSRRYPGRLGQ